MGGIGSFIKSNSTNDIKIARESKLGQFMVNNKIKYISGPCDDGSYITVVNGMHNLAGIPGTRCALQYIMCSVCGCYDGEYLSNVNPKNKRCICKCNVWDQPAPIAESSHDWHELIVIDPQNTPRDEDIIPKLSLDRC